MSDNDQDRPLIRNEDTLRRRAWIDRALAGVRERVKPDELGELSEPLASEPAEPAAAEPAEDGRPPRLYLVRNSDSR